MLVVQRYPAAVRYFKPYLGPVFVHYPAPHNVPGQTTLLTATDVIIHHVCAPLVPTKSFVFFQQLNLLAQRLLLFTSVSVSQSKTDNSANSKCNLRSIMFCVLLANSHGQQHRQQQFRHEVRNGGNCSQVALVLYIYLAV